jgi:hypothetical protein
MGPREKYGRSKILLLISPKLLAKQAGRSSDRYWCRTQGFVFSLELTGVGEWRRENKGKSRMVIRWCNVGILVADSESPHN